MRAVILAAGCGERLEGIVGDRPKCLVRLGDSTLLERQIRALHGCGIDRIVVVAGFGADDVARVCAPDVEIVLNEEYDTTNSLCSLWLTRALIADGFIVLNGDVLFHPQLLCDLLTARYEDALLVAARGDAGPYSEEEMKVRVRRGLVTGISKDLDEADAENIGIGRFGAAGAKVLIEEMDRLVAAGATREWLPRAFEAFCRRRPLHVVESRGLPWIEIDFPDDYWRACSDVLPTIEASTHDLSAQTPLARVSARSGRSSSHV
jgi:choline kinase